MSARPSVSVIVPFAGAPEQLTRLLDALGRLELGEADEVIVADNRPPERRAEGRDPGRGADGRDPGRPPAAERGAGRIRVCPAAGVCSPGFARNRAAAIAGGDWLVMIDADTEPSPGLLAGYFTAAPGPATAILAGAIVDRAGSDGVASRHAAKRGQMSQQVTLGRGPWAYAQSANCAVRRDAFVRAGGFHEDIRAGEDADLCFRLRAEGWELEERPDAVVVHHSRATVTALLAQLARHGSGAAWLERRYPGAFPAPRPRQLAARLARCAARAVLAVARGRREPALTAVLELAEASSFAIGRGLPNRARRPR